MRRAADAASGVGSNCGVKLGGTTGVATDAVVAVGPPTAGVTLGATTCPNSVGVDVGGGRVAAGGPRGVSVATTTAPWPGAA